MAAGALRVGNTVAAAIANTRILERVEANIALAAGALLVGIAVLAYEFPRAIAYPVAVIAAWIGVALVYRGVRLFRTDPGELDRR